VPKFQRSSRIPWSRAAALALIVMAPITAWAAQGFTISSPAYKMGQKMPAKYTCDKNSVNPPLIFGTPPSGTKSFAILGWDDDAPGGLASTWVVYDIPATASALPEAVPEGATPMNFKQGLNTAGKLGYSGPCPSAGAKPHRVYFDLYAINLPSLGLPAGASLVQVHNAIKQHKLLEAKLMGLAAR
jgi:Raf kinase inhibitor-like YbhB/YbcL family protein